MFIENEPNYTYVAARLLLDSLRQEALTFVSNRPEEATHEEMAARYPMYFESYIKRAIDLELMDPRLGNYDLAKLGAAIKPERDFNFKDMPEKAERSLETARKDAEKTVAKFRTALDKGMNPHPSYPFSPRSRGIGDLIYIEPYNLPSNNRIEEQKWDWPLEQLGRRCRLAQSTPG